MGITIKLHHPEAEQKPPEPPVAKPTPQPLSEADAPLQELLPETCRAPLPNPEAEQKPPEPPVAEPAPQKEPPALVINYPRSGKRVLPVGTTTIDIKQQNAHLPDDTVEEMYATRSVESCRSFAVYTDHMINIRISRNGSLLLTSSVFPAWFRKLDMIEFDTVEIECTEPTTFYIVMSEEPDGVPEHNPERWLSPCVMLGYNAAGDLVEIRKIINGITHTRLINDPDVADKTPAKWVEYSAWSVV